MAIAGACYKGACYKEGNISSRVGISGRVGIGASSGKDVFKLSRVPLLLYRAVFFFFFFYIQLYYTIYNTAHAASRLWRYSSIYMNPSQAA
jgi:hypothetical protein